MIVIFAIAAAALAAYSLCLSAGRADRMMERITGKGERNEDVDGNEGGS